METADDAARVLNLGKDDDTGSANEPAGEAVPAIDQVKKDAAAAGDAGDSKDSADAKS